MRPVDVLCTHVPLLIRGIAQSLGPLEATVESAGRWEVATPPATDWAAGEGRSSASPVKPASSTLAEACAMRACTMRMHNVDGSTAATLVTSAG
jgi:hypothetical protein